MTTLASTDDFTAITGTVVDGSNSARVTRLLELASDAVLAGAHGQLIVESTDTVTVRQFDGVFYLPQRPVTAIVSVIIGGVTVDPASYRFTPGGDGRGAKLIRRYTYGGNTYDTSWSRTSTDAWRSLEDWERQVWSARDLEATVTNTHGWNPIPGQLIAAVVAMANGVLTGQGGGQEVVSSQFSVAGYEQNDGFTAAQPASFAVSADTQALIDRLCKVCPSPNVPVAS